MLSHLKVCRQGLARLSQHWPYHLKIWSCWAHPLNSPVRWQKSHDLSLALLWQVGVEVVLPAAQHKLRGESVEPDTLLSNAAPCCSQEQLQASLQQPPSNTYCNEGRFWVGQDGGREKRLARGSAQHHCAPSSHPRRGASTSRSFPAFSGGPAARCLRLGDWLAFVRLPRASRSLLHESVKIDTLCSSNP